MSPDAQRKFISLINKRVALSIAAGALIEDKERELADINHTQDVIIDMLVHYPRAFIIGGAGTGKTWIGIKKIKRSILSGKRAIFLCYNPSLALRVKENLGSIKADVYNIDLLAMRLLGDDYSKAPVVNGCKEYADLLYQLPAIEQYDLVIVDEAQDFSEDWAYCANLLVKENGSLYVFYDESQNLYQRNFGDKFFINEEPFVLRYNIRNTSNIYRYALDRTALGMDTLVNQIEGVEPDIRKITRKQAVISFVDSIINKLVKKECVSPDKITIISNISRTESVFDAVNQIGGYPIIPLDSQERNGIIFSTIEDFKGLESDIIIFINHTYKGEPQTEGIRALQYTALTRARFYLYVIDYEKTL